MKKYLIVIFCLFGAFRSWSQTAQDRKDVERAMLDYIEGFYEGDTAKLARSVADYSVKYGYWKDDKSGKYAGEAMSHKEMMDYAIGIKAKNRQRKLTPLEKTEIFEVQETIASGKVTAWWGIDYILLEKINNKWMIRMVLWQGPIATVK
ncbi:MAG: nuclear transport factor 2 family protein [Chitinophagaceae bacterium]|nr:nuclear transport factor 2 family protein [Chitinophagaceae bacterium]